MGQMRKRKTEADLFEKIEYYYEILKLEVRYISRKDLNSLLEFLGKKSNELASESVKKSTHLTVVESDSNNS